MFEDLGGLEPRAQLCVGVGISREEVKNQILQQGIPLVANAITTLQDLCAAVLEKKTGFPISERILGNTAREEILRVLVSNRHIGEHLHQLKELRRQKNFFRKLDRALQNGRLAYAHADEEAVFDQRLTESFGENILRQEVRGLARAYEAWIQATGHWDMPRLLQEAIEVLREGDAETLPLIRHLSCRKPEGLEKFFWETLAQVTQVESLDLAVDLAVGESTFPMPAWDWQRSHSLDDSAEHLADQLLIDHAWKRAAVLIPDDPNVRRSLLRALEGRGIPLVDPRDPTRLKWDEAAKLALLPLELVGRDFSRNEVLRWITQWPRLKPPLAPRSQWIKEIHRKGVRMGLASYSGEKLSELNHELVAVFEILNGKKTCREVGMAHVKILRELAQGFEEWIGFFESFWESFADDLSRVGSVSKKAPARFWLERAQDRLALASPPAPRFRPEHGVALYRLQNASLKSYEKLWIFGAPGDWLEKAQEGDLWFSVRDRDLLSGEFDLHSTRARCEQRRRNLWGWFSRTQNVSFFDSAYDPDGKEREPLNSFLKDLGVLELQATEVGTHPRFAQSYNPFRGLPPQEVRLAARGTEFTATALDHASQCGLFSLVVDRWRVFEQEETDIVLWPQVRGSLLHDCVSRLLKTRVFSEGSVEFTKTAQDTVEEVWAEHPPEGLLKSIRIVKVIKKQLAQILETFMKKEKEFWDRAQTQTRAIDDMTLELEVGGVKITGRPDRIEETREALLISDFKTSSALPHGADMLDLSYRLQLPFYALAAQKALHKPVLGIQFVELTKQGSRTKGVFFPEVSGKQAGAWVNLRANSRSLMGEEPHGSCEDVWARFAAHIGAEVEKMKSGIYYAAPKMRKDCDRCRVSDCCGFRRLTAAPEEDEGGGGEQFI
ncbi:PD-(D/E)XK nuclease family protein [Bdellovibrionota bacterium FG-2]